jgi:hypothetical protein
VVARSLKRDVLIPVWHSWDRLSVPYRESPASQWLMIWGGYKAALSERMTWVCLVGYARRPRRVNKEKV